MSMRAQFVLFALSLALLAGCSDAKQPPVNDLSSTAEASSFDLSLWDAAAKAEAAATPDQGEVDLGQDLCNNTAALLNEALTKGQKVFKGIALTSSTAIKDFLDNPSQYTGQIIRIEGFITEICASAGCYVTLDQGGSKMNLKVVDGTYDFRQHAKLGNYAVGEGVPSSFGEHGAQVLIQEHGAMIGNLVCPLP